jgi:hypothetical protein
MVFIGIRVDPAWTPGDAWEGINEFLRQRSCTKKDQFLPSRQTLGDQYVMKLNLISKYQAFFNFNVLLILCVIYFVAHNFPFIPRLGKREMSLK